MAKVQKVSTKEFKEEAVKLAQSSGKPGAMSQTRRDHFKSFRFPRSETLQNWSKVIRAGAPAAAARGEGEALPPFAI